MKEKIHNLFGEPMYGNYTDANSLLDKVNGMIDSGEIKIDVEDPMSPMYCLNWGITYKIYDYLYIKRQLTADEIYIFEENKIKGMAKLPGVINHALECMCKIGITQPVNFKDISFKDVPRMGLDILDILYCEKKWELTSQIKS